MGKLLDLLAGGKRVLSDGAWGTMLHARGLVPGECPELWNLEKGDKVRSVAEAYRDAGSGMILTNTFGASRVKLEKYQLGNRVYDINRAGVELSLAGASGRAVVAASIGPTGEFLEPYGEMEEEEMADIFREQVKALAAGGAQAICIETMTAIEEAVVAVKAAKEAAPGLDVICTMTFDPVPDGYRTMMGVDVARAARELAAAGADIIGSNCGNGMEQMINIIREFRAHSSLPLATHVNAGVPELVGGKTVFRETPEGMASGVERMLAAGANLLGGCCGAGDNHIRAMAAEFSRLGVA